MWSRAYCLRQECRNMRLLAAVEVLNLLSDS